MKKNTVKNVTMIMFVISLVISVMMSVFTVLTGIVNKAIPPVIALLVVTVFFAWITLFYLNCYKWLSRKTTEEKTLHNLKTKNTVLMVIMSWMSCSMWFVLFGSVVLYRVFFEFQIYFLIVALITAIYAISNILIQKSLCRKLECCKNTIDT